MTTLYLIRHAEAEGNLYRIAQGQDNSNLTNRGWEQVALLQARFQDTKIDAVYASDLYRTCATASAVFLPKNLPLHRHSGLREICVGVWERQAWGEIAQQNASMLAAFTSHIHLWDIEGGEDPQEVEYRVEAAVVEIAAKHDGQTIAIFSHGCAIRLLLAKLQGYPIEEMGKTAHGDNTAVSKLEVDGDTIRVIFRDDNTHLALLNTGKKRANGLEPGLYFRTATMAQVNELFGTGLEEGITLVGYTPNQAAGFVQLRIEQDCGYITALGLLPTMRGKGFGVQLLGQAVMTCRTEGKDTLRISTEGMEETIVLFLQRYGFAPVNDTLWEKSIAFDPRFL